jgi:hypothetical protein
MVEVVGQCDAIPLDHFKNLVFTVAVEGCPLNCWFSLAADLNAPVIRVGVLGMAHDELASMVIAG